MPCSGRCDLLFCFSNLISSFFFSNSSLFTTFVQHVSMNEPFFVRFESSLSVSLSPLMFEFIEKSLTRYVERSTWFCVTVLWFTTTIPICVAFFLVYLLNYVCVVCCIIYVLHAIDCTLHTLLEKSTETQMYANIWECNRGHNWRVLVARLVYCKTNSE